MTESRGWRVLLVEDDETLRIAVSTDLTEAGMTVDVVADVNAADQALRRSEYRCAVFDRMLPDGDALHYVRGRRRQGWAMPVLFLTARDTLADRVDGFESGGDDYLVKPFAVAEMTARVVNLCRRGSAARPAVVRLADLDVDCGRREARRRGVLLALTAKEFAVLEYLLGRQGELVSRSDIIEHCWDEATDPMSNVVDSVVTKLRRKLGEPVLIRTVRGLGYRLSGGTGP